ncbi:MAG TPA: hypothetical protein VMB79_14965 [Jatrophihabitans sp.]|nr:hypothetical protein [Jatrophihabitans sp.]
MRIRRIAAVAVAAAVVGGGALVAGSAIGSAATAPPPTPISLNLTGMASSACPLPLNGSMAITPGTTVQFTPGLLSVGQSMQLTLRSEAKTTPPPAAKTVSVASTGTKLPFATAGTYDLSWKVEVLQGLLGSSVVYSQTGKIVVDAHAAKCTVAVQVPTPSVSVPVVPSGVTSAVNGLVGGAVSGANGALGSVNGAVGGVLGGVNGTVGGVVGGVTGGSHSGGGSQGSGPGTSYQPSGPTVAQRTVPQGYGSGSGTGGSYVGENATGRSITAPALGSVGSASSGGPSATKVKSGGSPHTVEVAANKSGSALDGWSTVILLAAVLALSGATAFYARTYLLSPLPAKVRAPRG